MITLAATVARALPTTHPPPPDMAPKPLPHLQPRTPLHVCALTLNRHTHPVAAPDGSVFESATILQLVRRTGINPITGQPLSPQALVPLSFSIDPRTSLPRCPILFHSFNQNIKIVAIATSGNVYSFAAVQRHNLHPANMTDLIDRTPFTIRDVIVLFDPQQHVWSTQPTTYPIHPPEPPPHHSQPIPAIQKSNLDSLVHHQPYIPNPSTQLPPPIHPTPSPYPSLSPHHHFNPKRNLQDQLPTSLIPKRPRLHPAVLPPPSSNNTPTHPSSDKNHSTFAYYQRKRAEDERKTVYKRIRKGRKGKGYVRVVTNIGHLNIELHCDKVPMTCDNFLSLAESKYYDGLRWHRVVPGFIAQTGDPTGTGDGGDSFWGGFFKDEIRTSLMHERPGVVSMANSGRDTNLSQWFICLDAAPHLDGSHTVFGKVVGGLFLLNKIETEAEMGHPLTVEKIEVLVNPIRQAREQLNKETIPKQLPKPEESTTPNNSQTSSAPSNKSNVLHVHQTHPPPVSSPIPTKHPAIHPQPQTPNPYSNRPPQSVQENLPPARTLLSAADIPPKHV